MKKKRYTVEQIVAAVQQNEAGMSDRIILGELFQKTHQVTTKFL